MCMPRECGRPGTEPGTPGRGLAAILVVWALAALAGTAAAQSTGSILGVVTGPAGEPLRGAQVTVLSPTLVASTGADGRFVLGGVPAGERVLQVQMLGYRPLTLARVQVRIGRPTELRLRLEAAPLTMPPLEVNAEASRLIEPDVSATHAVITGGELRDLPLDRLDQALALATGVSDGHFRGGRVGEESYVVDGLSVKNQLEGSTKGATLEYSPTAVEEVEVVTGGFGAEYGSALSGVVSYVTRRGDRERWRTSASLRGDGRLPGSRGFTALSLSSGGPLRLLGEGTTLFADVLAQGMADADPRARGIACLRPQDVEAELAARIEALQHDAAAARLYCPYAPALLPHDGGDKLIGFLRLDRPLGGGLAATATVLGNRLQRQLYLPEFRYNPSYQLGQRTEGTLATLALDWTGNRAELSRHAVLRLAASRLDRYLGALDAAALAERGSIAGFGLSRYRFLGEDFARAPLSAQVGSVPGYLPPGGVVGSPFGSAAQGMFFTSGTPTLAAWTRSDFLSAEAEGELYTVGGTVVRGGLSGRLFRVASYERAAAALADSIGRLTIFHPVTFAGFFETQWGTSDEVNFKVGVRLEGFRSGLGVPPDRADELPQVVRTGWKLAFMPRLGGAMPLPGTGGRTALRFNYARVAEPPDFQYFLDTTIGDSLRTSIHRIGNPELSFESGSAYEVGITQLLLPQLSAALTWFRKDLYNLVSGDVRFASSADPTFSLADFGSVQGLELSVRARWPGLTLRAGYALQKATGVSSSALGDTVLSSSETRVSYPLAFDRRHALNLSLLAGRSAGSARRWGAAMTATAQSGYPLEPRGEGAAIRPHMTALYLPWTGDVAGRASYDIGQLPGCGRCRWRAMAEGRNLLGLDNVVALRRDGGRLGPSAAAFAAVENSVPMPAGPIPYESPLYSRQIDLDGNGLITPEEFGAARFAAALDRFDASLYYGEPRQIRLGMEVSF